MLGADDTPLAFDVCTDDEERAMLVGITTSRTTDVMSSCANPQGGEEMTDQKEERRIWQIGKAYFVRTAGGVVIDQQVKAHGPKAELPERGAL